MSYGKMTTTIDIISTEPFKDAEGFVTRGDRILATVKAYKEDRNTSARWEKIIGSAAFTGVTALFRFRKIPGLEVNASHFIADSKGRYNIVSAEDVRGKGMYVELLCEKVEGTMK
ncbi:MAG: head-tail adaptor protein [Clostridia bacterium]|nr:head-tail adaptor protein [Clostridia bacterium]